MPKVNPEADGLPDDHSEGQPKIWMVYDQNFQQEVAGNLAQSWAYVVPSIYAQHFTEQAKSSENCEHKMSVPGPLHLEQFIPPKEEVVGHGNGSGRFPAHRQARTGSTECITFNGDLNSARNAVTCTCTVGLTSNKS